MSTWSLLSEQHQEVSKQIHLLEEASLDLLSKKVAHEKSKERVEDFEGLVDDFLNFFSVGLIHHFKIEEKAMFPILKNTIKDAEPLISELTSEHKNIIDKYFKFQESKNPKSKKMKDLTTLLEDLSEHARKEERFLPPFVALLNEEQLKKIDEQARRLGYSL